MHAALPDALTDHIGRALTSRRYREGVQDGTGKCYAFTEGSAARLRWVLRCQSEKGARDSTH